MTVLLDMEGRAIEDTYVVLESDEAPLPADGDVVVSLARWERERSRLMAHPGRLGVRLRSDDPPERISGDLDALDLVALEFPTFRDGRAYSHARVLRDRFDFRGEVRAVGDVLVEQVGFMLRVGFNTFELESADPEADFQAVAGELSVWYQPSADTRASAIELRQERR